jgi:DNA-binding MarR family transcriptional regulator
MVGDDRLGFLLARHGAIADRRLREALLSTGLTARQCVALMTVAGPGSMSQQALIEALSVDPSVLVAILNELESRELAARRRDPADRRRHIVEITAAGRAQLDAVDAALTRVEAELFADLDDGERAALRDLLARVDTPPDDDTCAGED